MRLPIRHACHVAAFISLLVLVTGCSRNWMRNEVKDHDLTVLDYPRGDLVVGSLGWGDPDETVMATRHARAVLSDSLLDDLQPHPIAWKNRSSGYNTFLDVNGSPGPQVLRTVELIGADAGVKLDRDKLKFIEWGDLREQSIDLHRLSQAIVRGWYNIPGESLSAEGLLALRPHDSSYTDRPWFVRRSIATQGLRYGIDKSVGTELRAKGNVIQYGKGETKVGLRLTGNEALEVEFPMALGINAWQLVSVTPPLPAFGDPSLVSFDSEYSFTWKPVPGRKKDPGVTFTVNTRELRLFAGVHATEKALPQATVAALETQLRQSTPASAGLVAEAASPAASGAPQWRPLQDGDAFSSDELVRLRVSLAEPAWIYILAKDNSGRATVLYPAMDGEPLSRGAAAQVPAGEWIYPGSVPGVEGDGMGFNPADPPGTESFVVVATKEPSAELGKALAQFAREARGAAATTRGDDGIALTSLTRVPTFYGASGASASAPAAPPSAGGLVYFSGVGNATVLTINLNRTAPAN